MYVNIQKRMTADKKLIGEYPYEIRKEILIKSWQLSH